MIPYDSLEHHKSSEELVKVLTDRTQVDEPLFFRLMVGYHFAMVAASMRTLIRMPEGNTVPVNMYCLNLAPSNFGKTRAANILSKEVLNQFIPRFLEDTFPLLAEENLPKIALRRASRKGSDPDEELTRTQNEFDGTGEMLFSFDSGTDAAVKQMRHKLLMANAGAMNLLIDEVGLHLGKNGDLLDVFMELYDGEVRTKLVKNTRENRRNEELRGTSPTNMMLFGTSNKLLDGGKQEEDLMSMLESGYARRCFFGMVKSNIKKVQLTPEQALQMAKGASQSTVLDDMSDRLGSLADAINANTEIQVPDETALLMYQYKLDCEQKAASYKEHEDIQKTETMSRFFKTIKLAGAYAFIDGSADITKEHLFSAIKLAEESGVAFERVLKREKPYAKLARYISDLSDDVTHADLVEELPFYPKSQHQRQDMLLLAIAWGYKNNIIIKKTFNDGIEFLRGETLKETDLDSMRVSYSTDIAKDYEDNSVPFEDLHQLTQAEGYHWVNHHLSGGHRKEENAIPGFNMVVIDVDGGVALKTAKLLLKDYKALYYTTKRHTEAANRFRIILPMNYELKLDAKDYKEFMDNLFQWLPFEVDDGTGQRARKWLSHNGTYEYTDGQLLDVLPFIPKTSKNEERKRLINDQQSLDNLERWVVNNTGDGNRNNMLLKYALLLVDSGFEVDDVRLKVNSLNDKLPDKLDEAEILSSIMITVSKAIAKR